MSTDPQHQYLYPNSKQTQPQLQMQSQSKAQLDALFKQQSKQIPIRPGMISFKADETKQLFRTARSGSVKQKLNLQNTRLKINVDNLSTLITIHQNNQNKLKIELDRYREKVLKYKQKIKQKDAIIAKLLEKLERRMQIDGANIQNLLVKLHQQYLRGFKYKLGRGENVQVADVIGKYQQLLKGFNNQEKQRLYLQKQKQDLENTILQLRQTIRYVGQGKQSKDMKNKTQSRQISALRLKLVQAQNLLEKQKQVRNYLMQNLRQVNVEIVPELYTSINQIQRNREFLNSEQFTNQTKNIENKLNQQLYNIRQKLAQSQTNLYKQKQNNKAVQKHCNKIQAQLSACSQKLATSNIALQNIQVRINKIQQVYSRELQQLQQKTHTLIKDSDDVEKYKSHVDQTSKKLSQTIKKFTQQSTEWTKLQNQYQNRIDEMRSKKRYIEDELEKQRQKRKLFQLKIISEDINNKSLGKQTIEGEDNENKQMYLDQRIETIVKQSLKNKKQNQSLNEQLGRGKRAYQLLQRQLKLAQQRIYQLIQSSQPNQSADQSKASRKSEPAIQSQTQATPSILPPQKSKQSIMRQIGYLNLSQLQNKVIELITQNSYLQNQITQLRNKCIDMQINYEQLKKMVELRDNSEKDKNIYSGQPANRNRVLEKGQPYIEKSSIQGGYQVNIINQNDLPADIQRMSFEQLASRYLAAKDQVMYLKQKIQSMLNQRIQNQQRIHSAPNQQQQFNSQQRYPGQNNNLQMILSQNQPEESNSQQIDEDTYKNINQQMDRLIIKNKQLQKQCQHLKYDYENQIATIQSINNQLKQKLKSAQEINTNLSNIVVHLQNQLDRLQNNDDISMQEQRGSDIMEGSSKRDKDNGSEPNVNQITKKITQKKKQFQEMLRSGSSFKDKKTGQYQNKLKNLQVQIKQLEQQRKRQPKQKRVSQKQSEINQPQQPKQCSNCQSLSKINSELIKKITTLQQSNRKKTLNYQKQLQKLQKQISPSVSTANSTQTLLTENKKIRNLLAQIKSSVQYYKVQNQNQQGQIANLRQINEQLVTSIGQKQKQLLKIRTDIIRQTYSKDPESVEKIGDILDTYEKKIQELENVIKQQQKSQINISQLYDTINYLHGQCDNLRKSLQSIPKSQLSIPLTTSNNQIPPAQLSNNQLLQKYTQLHNYLQSIEKFAQQHNYTTIEQLLNSIANIQQQNILHMKQIQKLQNKLQNTNAKNQQYFKKINEGKVYEIIQDKDKQIDDIKGQNQKVKTQLQNLARQRHSMFIQNQKINQDLKNIQENIQKLTGEKISVGQSTLANRSFQRTAYSSIPKQTVSSKYTPEQSQYILNNISRKLQILKSTINAASHKNRPNFQIQSFQQIPTLQDVVVILIDRIHYAWNIIEQRTNQYNQLRDQMNIISLQCMKNGQIQVNLQAENERSRSSQKRQKQKYSDVLEQRYEQVLAELVQYQNQNKRLEKQVTRLKQQISQYKKQMEDVQNRYIAQLRSQSSQDVPYSQNLLNRMLESGSSIGQNTTQKQLPQIIKLFLARIKQLEGNLQTIQLQFDEKNKRLQNLIQKQKSFISQSRAQKSEQSDGSLSRQRQPLSDRQRVDFTLHHSAQIKSNASPVFPQNQPDQKSYSLNSARVFKQIQQLTKANQQLRDKKSKYKGILENVVKTMEKISTKQNINLEKNLKSQIDKIVQIINAQIQQEAKKDNSGFDLQSDLILSSSFGPKGHKGKHTTGNLQEVKNTLENSQNFQKNKKKQAEQQIKTQKNLKFLEQNKFLLEDLLNKLLKIQKTQLNMKEITQKLASKLTDKQLQQILYISQADQAVQQILQAISQPIKKVSDLIDKNDNQINIQEGEWVETEQLQAIINQIYPVKSQLCLIVANSINMLMLAQTKQGILKAVQFLFTNLKNKQTQLKQQVKKRDQSVAQYGKKLQKLLTSKYSEQDSQDKSDLLNQNSFRKTTQFKSQYQIKKQQQKSKIDQSNSQSFSSGFQYK